MEEQRVAIAPNLKVILKPNTELLDEVVIVGYGTGKKLGSVVGSVERILLMHWLVKFQVCLFYLVLVTLRQ